MCSSSFFLHCTAQAVVRVNSIWAQQPGTASGVCMVTALGLQQDSHFTILCEWVCIHHVSVDVCTQICSHRFKVPLIIPNMFLQHAYFSLHAALFLYMSDCFSFEQTARQELLPQSRCVTESLEEESILDLLPVLYCVSQLC